MASWNQELSSRKTSRVLRIHSKTSETRGPLPKKKVMHQGVNHDKSSEALINQHQRSVNDCAKATCDKAAPATEDATSTSALNWNTWEERPFCSIGDAVSLALGLIPGKTSKALKDTSPIGKSFRRLFKSVCLAVRAGIISSGPEPVPRTGDLRKFATHLVNLRSVIEFLEASEHWRNVVPKEMIALKGKVSHCKGGHEDSAEGGTSSNESEVARRKAPDKFVAALIELLAEIGRRAGRAGLPFSVTEMPGQKRDLYELARRVESTEKDAPLDREFSTFTTYVKGLCCFKQGAKATDMYSDLFPELLAKSNP
jgi:hypothetical protein